MTSKSSTFSQSRALSLVLGLLGALMLAAKVATTHGFAPGIVAGVLAVVGVSAALTPRTAILGVNNFGILNNTLLFHEAFTEFWQMLLPITRMCINVANEVNLDDGGTVLVRNAKPGDLVTIKNWKQTFNVYDVTPANGYNTPTAVAPADKQFQLPNNAKACSIVLTPTEFRLLSGGVSGGTDYETFRTKVINGMLHSIGTAVVTDFMAVFQDAAYTNVTVSAPGTFTNQKELEIEKAFFDRNVPLENPQIILNSTAFAEWVGSHANQQQYTGQPIQKNLLFMGQRESLTTPFSFSRTNVALPAAAPRGLGLMRSAVLGAFRIPWEPTYENDSVSLTQVVDPNTGVGCLLRLWKVPGKGDMQLDIASIWKFDVGQPECAQLLKAA